jgi:sulfopyruvate decarboxylase subunit alpha
MSHALSERSVSSTGVSAGAKVAWQDALAEAFVAAGVDVAAWVPDKRLAPIGEALERRGMPLRTLTREEECIGFAAGYRAAGKMPIVLMQCSGLGNSLNALGSLAIPYGLAFPLVLSMRGTLGERNPAQTLLGRTTQPLLELLGVQTISLASGDQAGAAARGALDLADGARVTSAILLEPTLELGA